MKIAVIDNTCNQGYVLMRYLNDLGYDTDLLLIGEVTIHSDPEHDTYNDQLFSKIVHTGWGQKGLIFVSKKELRNILEKYDFVIGSDFSPAFFYRIGRKLDVFLPHGTDIFNYPFIKLKKLTKKNIGQWIFAKWQFKGIQKNTVILLFELTNDINEEYIRRIKNAQYKRIYDTIPQIYKKQYHEPEAIAYRESNIYSSQLKKMKDSGTIIIFHHCQQQWKNPYHILFNKGNDKLIRGFADFVRASPETKIKLVMIERGGDLPESKRLIDELGINNYVIWFPIMPRKDIMACLSYVDLGIGELGHSWYTYSVVSEFLVMGIPIIHKCDLEYYKKIHSDVYPMFNASDSHDVCSLLKQYLSDPQHFKTAGAQGAEWWQRNILEKFILFIRNTIGSNNVKDKNSALVFETT